MATFKPTSKATKTGGTTSKTFTPTKYAGYNQSKVYGWQAQNKSALDLLNEYYNRINAGEWLSNEDRAKYKSAIDTYTTTGNALRDVSKFYGTKYTDEEEKSWQDSLSSLNKGYTSANDFYNQFASDKVYNDWREGQKRNEDYQSKLTNIDVNKATQGWEKYQAENQLKKFGYDEAIMQGFSTMNDNPFITLFNQSVYNYRNDDSHRRPNDNWTQEQRNAFGQLYLENPAKAFQFAEETNNRNNKAQEEAKLNSIKSMATDNFGSGVLHTLGSLGGSLFALGDVLDDAAKLSAGRDINKYNNYDGFVTPNEYSQAVQGGITEKLNEIGTIDDNVWMFGGKGLGDAYALGTSIVQSMAYGGIAKAMGSGAVSLIGYFGQAAAQGMDDAIERGADGRTALLYGTLMGAVEAGAEQIGIDNLLKTGNASSFKGVLKNILKQSGAEALEEGITSIASSAVDNWLMGDHSNFAYDYAALRNQGYSESDAKKRAWANSVGTVLFDTLAGGISGGISGGIYNTAGTAIDRTVKGVGTKMAYGNNAGAMATNALLEISPNDAYGQKMQTKLGEGKNLSAYQVGKTMEREAIATHNYDVGQIKSAVSDRLTELGERGNVAKISDAIAREQAGEELSLGEKNLIKKSDFGKSVRAELNPETLKSDTEMNRWAESIGTRRLNSDVYSKRPPSVKVQTNEGKSSEIGSIKAVEGDVATVELSDGTVAKVGLGKNTQSEVKFNDAKTEEMFKIATERIGKVEGWTVESANAMVTAFEHSSNGLGVSDFTRAWSEAYNIGRNNNSRAQLNHSSYATLLDEATRSNAYNIGKAIYSETRTREQAPTRTTMPISTDTNENISRANIEVKTNDGVRARIDAIKSINNDIVTVELNNGKEARIGLGKNEQRDVTFSNPQTEQIFKIATERIGKVEGWTSETASAMINAYNGQNIVAGKFAKGWQAAYNIGRNNNSMAQLNSSPLAMELDAQTRADAYNIGKAIAMTPATVSPNAKYSVTFDETIDPSTFNKKQKNDIKALEIVSKALGVNVKVFDSPVNAKGERIGKNGSYNPTTRTIEVDLHAGNHGEGIINLTSAHEVTHHMKVVARDQFNNYADAVFETLGEDGKVLIANKLEQLSRNGHLEGMTEEEAYDLAFEEVVADSSERMFVDTDALVKLAETLKKKDKTLWEKFRDGVVNILNKLKKAYAELNPQSEAAQALMNAQDKLENIKKLWVEGVVAAAEVSDQVSTEKSETKNQDRDFEDYDKPITIEDVNILRSIGRKSINDFTLEEIKKAQKWAYKFYQELGVKSPFFRAWFGEWRAHQKSILVDIAKMENFNGKNPRGSYKNKDTGWNINSSSVGYDETIAHSGKDKQSIIAMKNIDKIIENAILFDTEVSEYGRGKKSIYTAFMHKFYAPINIDGKIVIAKMSVDESYSPGQTDTNKKFYHVRAIEIETASSLEIGKSHTSIMENTVSKYSISDLYELVKTFDKDFSPAPEVNKVMLNEDGTPRVFYHGTNENFTEFKPEEMSSVEGSYFFAENRMDAEAYGDNIYEVYLSARKLADYDNQPSEFYRLRNKRAQVAWLKERGYDGWYADMDSGGWGELSVFSPEQIKSATDNIGTFSKGEKNIKYSDRTTETNQDRLSDEESFSNRSILANALASTATSDEETELLKEYQKEIAKLDANDVKIAQYKSDLKALYEKEQPNFTVIKELKGKIKKLEGQNYYHDKKLLQLESTTALKNVLKRARKDSYAKAMQKGKELMHKNVEGRYKTIERNKIKKIAHELDTLLNKGNKKRNVKIGAQGVVRAALDLSDMYFTSDDELVMNGIKTEATDKEASAMEQYKELYEKLHATDDDVTNHKEERAEIRHEMNEIKKDFAELLERERKRINNTKAKTVYNTLIEEYEKLANSPSRHIAQAFDADTLNHIKTLRDNVGENLVREMTLEQIKDVYKAFKMVKTMVTNSNKLFNENLKESVDALGNEALHEIEKHGHKEKFTKVGKTASEFSWNNLKPVYLMERTGSPILQKLFQKVLDGESVWAKDMLDAREYIEKQKNEYKYDSWDFKKTYEFSTPSGKTFKLNLEQIMTIYAYSNRGKQAIEHLSTDGFVFDKVVVKEKGVEYELNDKTAYKITDEVRIKMTGLLTQNQKDYVDAMQKYLSKTMGAKGNEVSKAMYGIELYGEENYLPIHSEGAYLERAREQAKGDVKLKNKGFTKSTVKHARNAIVLSDFDKLCTEHIAEMSSYHAFTLPLEDFYKVYNYQVDSDDVADKRGVIPALENAYGKGATGAIDQLLTDLNGGARGDSRETIAKKGIALYKKAKVMLSLSVVIQQPSSIIRAQAMIDPKYFVGQKIGDTKRKELWAEMKKYAPVTIIKEMGYFDVGMGKASADWLLDDPTLSEKIDEIASKPAAKADELTWIAIWNAVKRETASKNTSLNTSSVEFLEKAGERFEDVIRHTQVYDSTLARSGNMRSKSAFMQMTTSFMAEPTTSLNMREAALRSKDARRIARTTAAIYGATLLNAVLVAIPYAMRDDDEDETFLEKYITALSTSFVDNLNPINSIPFAKDIWSLMQGYNVDRADMSAASTLIDSFNKLVKMATKEDREQGDIENAILNLIGNLSSFSGLPIDNVRRDVMSVFNTYKTLTRGYDTTWKSIEDALQRDFQKSTPVWNLFKTESKNEKLYEAVLAKDEKYVERFKSIYKDEDAYYSALRKAIRENDPRVEQAAKAGLEGDNDTYYNLMYDVIEEGHFDSKLIKQAFEAEYNSLKEKKEEAEAKK